MLPQKCLVQKESLMSTEGSSRIKEQHFCERLIVFKKK
jgi:hypothetical protein